MKRIIFLTVLFVLMANACFAQSWMKLVPLESTREEVEKILGEPDSSFPTYATYRTDSGNFHVWFSTGECQKNFEGRQYKVRANVMTHLSVYLNAPLLKSVISNLSDYTRQENFNSTGYLYISKDESITYETFMEPERVKSIDLMPGRVKTEEFLCKSGDLK